MEKNVIPFVDAEHESFYYENIRRCWIEDCYHKALVYCLGISEDTRRNVDRIFDFQMNVIKPECLKEGWITSGSQMVIYLAFNLYTDTMPTARERSRKQDQIRECRRYSVSDIFACNYARYFWAAVQIRYPEYCMG